MYYGSAILNEKEKYINYFRCITSCSIDKMSQRMNHAERSSECPHGLRGCTRAKRDNTLLTLTMSSDANKFTANNHCPATLSS